MRAHTICENEGCPNNGKIINTFVFPAEDEDDIYEQYGHGAEDPEDFCPECGELGILQDPLDGSFDTACPYCHVDGELAVVHLTADTDIPLHEDGFSTTDAKRFDTSDEVVHCKACDKRFPLSEVTV